MGTENLDKAVDVFMDFIITGVKSQADGFQVTDLLQLIAPATALPAVIEAWPKTQEEINDIDLTELERIRARIEAKAQGTVTSEEAMKFILDATTWVAVTYTTTRSGLALFGKAAVN